jgi:WD40 repeat protein
MLSHVAFSPDGNHLATTSWDKAVKVWNLTTRKNIATITGHIKEVHSIAFSPDGKRLLTASGDQTVKVWDIAKANPSR